MNSIALRGTAADLRYGYRRAASLGPWTIDSGHLSAQVLAQDAFSVSQRPLSFVVHRPNGVTWTWSLDDVTVTGSTLTATVVPESGGA